MAIISNDTQDFTTERTKCSECQCTSKETIGLRYYFGFDLWVCDACFSAVKDRILKIRRIEATKSHQTSMDVIVFTGHILDGYNDDLTPVVIVDIGVSFRIYHAKGYYTTPKTITWSTL